MPRVRVLRHTNLRIEELESRVVPRAGLMQSDWIISGDRARNPDDTMVVGRVPGRPVLLQAVVNGKVVGTRPVSSVKSIVVQGGRGDDTITIRANANLPASISVRLVGGPGDDRLTGGNRVESLEGGDGNDKLVGGGGNDSLLGGSGDDILDAGAGNDHCNGGEGDDTFLGGEGHDRLIGGVGADTVEGGAGADYLDGGSGEDALFGGSGNDILAGGTETDDIFGLDEADRLIGDDGDSVHAHNANPIRAQEGLDWVRDWVVDRAQALWGPSLGRRVPDRWWGGGAIPPYFMRQDGLVAMASPQVMEDALNDSSGTNNQENGVEEADIFQTDGEYLYTMRDGSLTIIDARVPSSLAVVGTAPIEGWTSGFYLSGNRLVVVSSAWGPGEGGDVFPVSSRFMPWFGGQARTVVTTFDVSDKANPIEEHKAVLDGSLSDSRMVGGRVYVVLGNSLDIPEPLILHTARGDYYEGSEAYLARVTDQFEDALPEYTADGITAPVVAGGQILAPRWSENSQLMSIAVFDPANQASAPVGLTTTVGTTGAVYASTSSLYVASTDWAAPWMEQAGPATQVYKFGLEGDSAPLEGFGTVDGMVLNQFSMDEEGGYFRIATTSGWGNQTTNSVIVMEDTGDALETVGAITDLGLTERIYSVRFEGDHGFVVTFRQTDPFFTLDLSDPLAPRVAGELELPGYSSYLQEIGQGLVVGLGRNADANGRVNGLKLSLFDTSDLAFPMEIASQTLSSGSVFDMSAAEWDHHAISWFPAQGILALPMATFNGQWESSHSVMVLGLSSAGIETLGVVPHESAVQRTLRINDLLFSISGTEILVNRLANPAELVGQLALPSSNGGGGEPFPID